MADGLSLRALEEELPIKVVGPLNLIMVILERDQGKEGWTGSQKGKPQHQRVREEVEGLGGIERKIVPFSDSE